MLFSRNEIKQTLSKLTKNDPSITTLQLSHKRITNKQLLAISDALQGNTNVTEIWLTNNQISDGSDANNNNKSSNGSGSVGYLMSVLETNTTVQEVYLGGNKIGAKGVSSIANLLQQNTIITDIGLEDNSICDGGAKMLADALSHNTTLQTLKLQGNDIQSEQILKTIQDQLKKNKTLAKEKFALEHPELLTHKIKKPVKTKEEESKEERRRRRRERHAKKNSGGGDNNDGKNGRRSKESSSPSSSRSSNTTNNNKPASKSSLSSLLSPSSFSKSKTPADVGINDLGIIV